VREALTSPICGISSAFVRYASCVRHSALHAAPTVLLELVNDTWLALARVALPPRRTAAP
jgi:hypothetical protein